jgi:hypothetical protein
MLFNFQGASLSLGPRPSGQLTYNTTPQPLCQHLFLIFLHFFGKWAEWGFLSHFLMVHYLVFCRCFAAFRQAGAMEKTWVGWAFGFGGLSWAVRN